MPRTIMCSPGDSARAVGRLPRTPASVRPSLPRSLPPMPPDFAAEGLLDGLEGDARAARERLLRRLHDEGVSLEELTAAGDEDRLGLMPAERLIGAPTRYTPREVAERAGIDLELLDALRRAQGLPVPEPDQLAYTESDLEGAESARRFREAGLATDDMLAITRVLGRGLAQAAELMRDVTLDLVLEPGTPEDELALRYAEATSRFTPLTMPVVGQLLAVHLRHVVRSAVIGAAEREAGGPPGARKVAIAFADLVGFTRIGEELAPDELGRVADRLEELTAQRLESPVRLVKPLGDAVMLVSPEPRPLLDVTLALVDAADAEGEEFPQLR